MYRYLYMVTALINTIPVMSLSISSSSDSIARSAIIIITINTINPNTWFITPKVLSKTTMLWVLCINLLWKLDKTCHNDLSSLFGNNSIFSSKMFKQFFVFSSFVKVYKAFDWTVFHIVGNSVHLLHFYCALLCSKLAGSVSHSDRMEQLRNTIYPVLNLFEAWWHYRLLLRNMVFVSYSMFIFYCKISPVSSNLIVPGLNVAWMSENTVNKYTFVSFCLRLRV